jgi:hypothetical protein
MIMCMDSALQIVQLRKGAVMSRKLYPLMKSVVVAGVLGLGVYGVANADDSSMNPFQGESFKDFNGGYDLSCRTRFGTMPMLRPQCLSNPPIHVIIQGFR